MSSGDGLAQKDAKVLADAHAPSGGSHTQLRSSDYEQTRNPHTESSHSNAKEDSRRSVNSDHESVRGLTSSEYDRGQQRSRHDSSNWRHRSGSRDYSSEYYRSRGRRSYEQHSSRGYLPSSRSGDYSYYGRHNPPRREHSPQLRPSTHAYERSSDQHMVSTNSHYRDSARQGPPSTYHKRAGMYERNLSTEASIHDVPRYPVNQAREGQNSDRYHDRHNNSHPYQRDRPYQAPYRKRSRSRSISSRQNHYKRTHEGGAAGRHSPHTDYTRRDRERYVARDYTGRSHQSAQPPRSQSRHRSRSRIYAERRIRHGGFGNTRDESLSRPGHSSTYGERDRSSAYGYSRSPVQRRHISPQPAPPELSPALRITDPIFDNPPPPPSTSPPPPPPPAHLFSFSAEALNIAKPVISLAADAQMQNNYTSLNDTLSKPAPSIVDSGATITAAAAAGDGGVASTPETPATPKEHSPADGIQLYTKISMVGEGTYGKVYKARNRETGQIVALKRMRIDMDREGFPITAMREIRLLKQLAHHNITQVLDVLPDSSNAIYVVMEYMDYDLSGLINHPQWNPEPAHQKSLMQQLLDGLDFMHAHGILHRDIKGSNLLVNRYGQVKYVDFGLARSFHHTRMQELTNRVITLWYRPPELLLGTTLYGPEVDIWSLGCVILELFLKKPAFQGQNDIDQLEQIFKLLGTPSPEVWDSFKKLPWACYMTPNIRYENRLRQTLSSKMSPCAVGLISWMLSLSPSERPSAAKCLSHSFFVEAPAPVAPTSFPVSGDWHEYESKAERRKRKQAAKQQQQQQLVSND